MNRKTQTGNNRTLSYRTEKKSEKNECNRISEMIMKAKEGDAAAALGLLFNAKEFLNKKNQMGELLRAYIQDCLNECLSKPLSNRLATHELFPNMRDAKRKDCLYKAFHLNRPDTQKYKNLETMRNYRIMRDYFSLTKKANKRYKRYMFIECLGYKYGLKSRQMKEIIKNKPMEKLIVGQMNSERARLSGVKKNELSLNRILLKLLAAIAEKQTLDALECSDGDKKLYRIAVNPQANIKIIKACSEMHQLLSKADRETDWNRVFDIAFCISHEIAYAQIQHVAQEQKERLKQRVLKKQGVTVATEKNQTVNQKKNSSFAPPPSESPFTPLSDQEKFSYHKIGRFTLDIACQAALLSSG